MTNASRDNNNVPTIIGTSNTDGSTILRMTADPSTHGLMISDGVGGTDYGFTSAEHDDNSVPTILAVSSSDGTTPVPIYLDSSTGALLIKTT